MKNEILGPYLTLLGHLLIVASASGFDFHSRTVSAAGEQGVAMAGGDVDGDGDTDLVVADAGGELVWFENLGAPQYLFARHCISALDTSFDPVDVMVKVSDLDQDFDLDIVITDDNQDILVFANDGQSPPAFVLTTISGFSLDVRFELQDMDGDGDLDVITASSDLAWHENTGGIPLTFNMHSLGFQARDVFSANLDGDSDLDLVIHDSDSDSVIWLERLDETGIEFAPHTIGADHLLIDVFDANDDGFADFLSGTTWYQSDGQSPPSFTPLPIGYSVRPGLPFDIDSDGDIDFFTSRSELFLLIENTGGPSPAFGERVLDFCDNGDEYGMALADIDQDGRVDVITSDSCGGGILWHQNRSQIRPPSYCKARDLLLEESTLPQVAKVDGVTTNEGLGRTVTVLGDINGDSIDDMLLGTGGSRICENPWSGLGTFAGKAYIVFGTPELKTNGFPDLSEMTSNEGCIINPRGAFHPATRIKVSEAGDVNGDGTPDMLISEFEADSMVFTSVGRVYVVFGSPDMCASAVDGELDLMNLDGANGFTLYGLRPNQDLGSNMAALGDINHDGFDDFYVGGFYQRGYIIFGKQSWEGTYDLSAIDEGLGGGSEGVLVSGGGTIYRQYSVARAGDFNHDGLEDFIIGDWRAASDDGLVYIVFGRKIRWPSIVSVGSAGEGVEITGDSIYGYFGFDVDSVGDVNGDSIDDIIVGEPFAPGISGPVTPLGQAHVFYGRSNPPASLSAHSLNGTNGFSMIGSEPKFATGSCVSSVGDHNGDGIGDFLLSQPRLALVSSTIFVGHDSFVVFGGSTVGAGGLVDLNKLDGINGYIIHGQDDDEAGRSIAHGDVDGDGLEDILLGAPGANAPSCIVASGGRVYIIFGCDESDFVPGDHDADGDVDLLDFGGFQLCYTGACSAAPCDPALYPDSGCRIMDFDFDGDVDLLDFGQFQLAFTG